MEIVVKYGLIAWDHRSSCIRTGPFATWEYLIIIATAKTHHRGSVKLKGERLQFLHPGSFENSAVGKVTWLWRWSPLRRRLGWVTSRDAFQSQQLGSCIDECLWRACKWQKLPVWRILSEPLLGVFRCLSYLLISEHWFFLLVSICSIICVISRSSSQQGRCLWNCRAKFKVVKIAYLL